MKRIVEAATKAKADTARFMTKQLRSQATAHGWDADVVEHLHVIHEDGKFKTHVDASHADRAFVHEFGNENTRPTAALRKFSNDTKLAERAFTKYVDRRLGDK